MFWKRTVGIDGATFYLYQNKFEDPLCKFHVNRELLESIDGFKKGVSMEDHVLIRALEAGIRDRTELTEEDIEKAIDILCYMQYEER